MSFKDRKQNTVAANKGRDDFLWLNGAVLSDDYPKRILCDPTNRATNMVCRGYRPPDDGFTA
jgi:hypothetical protein